MHACKMEYNTTQKPVATVALCENHGAFYVNHVACYKNCNSISQVCCNKTNEFLAQLQSSGRFQITHASSFVVTQICDRKAKNSKSHSYVCAKLTCDYAPNEFRKQGHSA